MIGRLPSSEVLSSEKSDGRCIDRTNLAIDHQRGFGEFLQRRRYEANLSVQIVAAAGIELTSLPLIAAWQRYPPYFISNSQPSSSCTSPDRVAS
jgi:hypothetical protein